MARFHFNAVRKIASTHDSVAWGKINTYTKNLRGSGEALLFAAVLIVCSLAVGCSSDKPKPANTTSPAQVAENTMPAATPSVPASLVQAETPKPVHKRIVHRRPPTLSYADKSSGVSFEYPRRYDLMTGDDAGKLVSSIPLPMNFVQPGGVALAAVELPGRVYNANDLAAAFFNVSVNKNLTAEQCGEFLPPGQPEPASSQANPASPEANPSAQPVNSATASDSSTPAEPPAQTVAQTSKLILGDLELAGTEAVTGEGTRQSDAKYFHVFQNGACYEFAVNVTTSAPDSQLVMKHVDREKAFQQLEKILATVKIGPVATPEVAATAPTTPVATPASPAQ
ncbi:MAG TPA: hypothetical protein VMU61_13090 [Candidatus Aquilonibacter sp.]|nr:hypothetical protein [Candidatus Aquilonibacter sp.]